VWVRGKTPSRRHTGHVLAVENPVSRRRVDCPEPTLFKSRCDRDREAVRVHPLASERPALSPRSQEAEGRGQFASMVVTLVSGPGTIGGMTN